MSGLSLGLGLGLTQSAAASAPPADTFNILTEDGSALDTEAADKIVTESHS